MRLMDWILAYKYLCCLFGTDGLVPSSPFLADQKILEHFSVFNFVVDLRLHLQDLQSFVICSSLSEQTFSVVEFICLERESI